MKNLCKPLSVMILGMLALSAGCSVGNKLIEPARYSLPASSAMQVRLVTSVTSDSASVGQPVSGQVVNDIATAGHVVIPAGSQVTGTVTAVRPAKRFGGQAMVAVDFDTVSTPSGEMVAVEGSMAAYADKQKAKDTGAIVGGTLGGALLGRVIGKDTKGAVAGAVVGGGVGTAIASRKGDEAHLPSGTSGKVRTTRALDLPEA
jgi:hypothetical protein